MQAMLVRLLHTLYILHAQATFPDKTSLPRIVRLYHAPSSTSEFVQLVPETLLTINSKHLFTIGADVTVQRFLKIVFQGHMLAQNSAAGG